MFTGEKEHEHGKQGRRHTRIGRRCMRCGTLVSHVARTRFTGRVKLGTFQMGKTGI